MTWERLRNYYRDQINDGTNENVHNRISNNKTISSKYFEYKTNLISRTPDDNDVLDPEIVVNLKHLSNFWGSLYLLLQYNQLVKHFKQIMRIFMFEFLLRW